MTIHIITIRGRRVRMNVHETEAHFGCHLSYMEPVPLVGITCSFSAAEYEQVYAWFNAIIADLRENSDKTIYLYDRQHVMTT